MGGDVNIIAQAKEVLDIECEGLVAVKQRLDERFVQAVEIIANCPTRLVVTGIGKSGVIGQKICATLNSTGTPSFFLHPVEALHGDLGMVCVTDVVLAISYSGETTELNGLLASLKERGVSVIAMTGNMQSTLAKYAAVTLDINIPREACPLGLAPTTSTTATLALGDALAVTLLQKKQFKAEDFRRNHPGGSLGERLKVAVREVMLSGDAVPVITQGADMATTLKELNRANIGAVMVTDPQGFLKGIITDGDVRRIITSGASLDQIVVDQVMTQGPVTITSETMAADALSLMQSREITVLAVVDEQDLLLGILHLHDLLGKGEFRFLI
ncbi:MAG: arabinose-5-phosphate isomerase [Desulfobulbus propionicus]|nr:MAG: arabinose-5-phosphate isomerase [Desulfobulbus propionicus]PIE66593.1 MAG: arabinose-5-phosphate isomerase [Desulfobacterales bacterium]